MIAAASWPRDDPRTTRLLHVDPRRGVLADHAIGELRDLLRAPDLLVVNDAATIPASLGGVTRAGAAVEVRLAGAEADGTWRAVLFGAGDWRRRTEDRQPPPPLRAGDVLELGGGGAPAGAGTPGGSGAPGRPLRATLTEVDPRSPRLVRLRFDACGAALWRALYSAGRPVQYAHTARPLALWQVQTAYAGRPWAAEAPSAGFTLTWELLLDLRRRGIATARVTHAAGLSSTGDGELDARLPLAERYEVPEDAVRAIAAARERGGRVVAVGSTVTRALEGAAARGGGRLAASRGMTELRLGPGARRSVVDGILTGLHEPGTSHFALLESFAPRALLARAQALAEEHGYRGHEFGDALLILGEAPAEIT